MLKIKQLQLTQLIKPGFWNTGKNMVITLSQDESAEGLVQEIYSPNLIEGDLCYKIAINSLPGNKIIINDNEKSVIRIGASGVFNMDFGNNPIFSLRVSENNQYDLYDMYIDLVYLSAKEDA